MGKKKAPATEGFKYFRGRHPADPLGTRYGDTHMPITGKYAPGKVPLHVVINLTTGELVQVSDYQTVWEYAIAEGHAPADLLIGPVDKKTTYSAIDYKPMAALYKSLMGRMPAKDTSYNDALSEVMEYLLTEYEPIPTPASRLTGAIVQPEGEELAPTVQPQQQAGRAKRKPPVKRAPAVAPAKRAPAGPANRPKPGSATGKVWDIADEQRAANPDADKKALRALVKNAATAEGINPSTVSVQYGKWWSTTQE